MPVKNYVPCKIAQNTKRNLVPWKAEAAASRTLPRATPAKIAKGSRLIPWQPVIRPNRYIPVMPVPGAPAPVPGGIIRRLIPPMYNLDGDWDNWPENYHWHHNRDYLGFVDNSYIEMELTSPLPTPMAVSIIFRGYHRPDINVLTRIDQDSNDPKIYKLYFSAYENTNKDRGDWKSVGYTKLPIGECPPGYNEQIWGRGPGYNGVDGDRFDHVCFELLYSPTLPSLRTIKMVLNGTEIMNESYSPAKTIKLNEPWYWDEMIWRRRLKWVHYFGTTYPSFPTSGTNREMLLWAASDLGQSWSPWYCSWHTGSGRGYPRKWCSEYVNYTIARATGGSLVPYGVGSNFGSSSMRYFFEENDRFISHNLGYDYDQLGSLIKPGFYARVNNGGHSTMFLSWCDDHGNPTRFRSWEKENFFLAIGGNQRQIEWDTSIKPPYPFTKRKYWTRHIVSIDRYSVAKKEKYLTVKGINWLNDRDGFGDTSNLRPLYDD